MPLLPGHLAALLTQKPTPALWRKVRACLLGLSPAEGVAIYGPAKAALASWPAGLSRPGPKRGTWPAGDPRWQLCKKAREEVQYKPIIDAVSHAWQLVDHEPAAYLERAWVGMAQARSGATVTAGATGQADLRGEYCAEVCNGLGPTSAYEMTPGSLPVPSTQWLRLSIPLHIEVKKVLGGRASAEQLERQRYHRGRGAIYEITCTPVETIHAVTAAVLGRLLYLGWPPGKIRAQRV